MRSFSVVRLVLAGTVPAGVPDTNLSTIMTGGTMGNENGVTH
ncbi:MAG: hypothetical protein ACYDEJ_10745 [Desulfitobacteriaceae bacterium]